MTIRRIFACVRVVANSWPRRPNVSCVGSPHFAAVLCLFLLTAAPHASAKEHWPTVPLPKAIEPFNIGQQVTINGLPMRLQGFVSEMAPAELLQAVRRTLGKPLVENKVGAKHVLGRAENGFYLTVQIEAAGQGSSGTVAITDLGSVRKSSIESRSQSSRWLDRLPSGSKFVSRMTSEDAGKVAAHMVIANGHSESLNRDALAFLMREEGYELEREAATNGDSPRGMPGTVSNGTTLFFKGAGREAVAVIAHEGNGRTFIVLNTVILLEAFK